MAQTYDDYERLKGTALPGSGCSIEDRMDKAVEQTELLQDVRRRVERFIEAYEDLNGISVATVTEMRGRSDASERTLRIADNIERSYQEIYSQGHLGAKDFSAITLDDLKILLDQFPQKDA